MQLTIDLGERSYPVIIGSGLIEKAGQHLKPYIRAKQVCIVSNETVAPLYLEKLKQQLEPNYQSIEVILPDGENHKNLETLNKIFSALLEAGFNRDVTLIALGGGVVGDITGFAAASYMRGVDFIQIPTTLLAQVDSSVGGKTGVNHELGKNMIGAFYQPRCVLADVGILKTLPARELSAGLAEVIKYGLIIRSDFLPWLEEHMPRLLALEEESLIHAVQVSCDCKAHVVSRDEREKGLRAILNLGHTFGHAIEAYYKYNQYLHGEAVAIGMAMACRLSHRLGYISEQDTEFAIQLMIAANLPVQTTEKIAVENLIQFMKVDKKAESGKIKLVLLKALGEAFVSDEFDSALMEESMRMQMGG